MPPWSNTAPNNNKEAIYYTRVVNRIHTHTYECPTHLLHACSEFLAIYYTRVVNCIHTYTYECPTHLLLPACSKLPAIYYTRVVNVLKRSLRGVVQDILMITFTTRV